MVVRQRLVALRLFLVLDHLLRARCSASELAVVPQVLAPQASLCAVCGTQRVGARIVFRLSTARTLRVTSTLVAGACGSSLSWNQGALRSRPALPVLPALSNAEGRGPKEAQ